MTHTLIKDPAQLAEILTNLPPDSTIELRKSSTGEIAVSYDTPPKTKADLINADPKLRALRGQPITVTEAVTRYGVPKRTLLDWKIRSFITVLEEGYQMTLDEADVAYCVGVYRQRKASGLGFRGVPLLDEHGAPYQLKQPKVARYRRRMRDLQKKAQQSGA